MISLCINGQWETLPQVDPSMTLLRYLRTRKKLPGTKEGCASGDCGACTVMVGTQIPAGTPVIKEAAVADQADPESGANAWQYATVNACITFLSQLDGKAVVTAEGLADGELLHPAQQAMVDCHGSQCGFCTPGFVMSLAALYENTSSQPSREEIIEALAGNLCRCTGYRPIVDAAEAMYALPRPAVGQWAPATIDPSASDVQAAAVPADGSTGAALIPRSEDELKTMLAAYPDARLVAGATDLALEVTQQHRELERTITLNRIPALARFEVLPDFIDVGAMVSYRQLEPLFHEHYPEFAHLLTRLGSRQIRNQGTLGGNIGNASPIGDTPPVLIALQAELELASHKGERWLPLEQFYTGYKQTVLQPGEYIRRIRIPRLKEGEVLKVYKISKRFEDDISAVLMAIRLHSSETQITDVAVAFGGMAAVPARAPSVEAALQSAPLTPASFEQAAAAVSQDFDPLSDVRASRRYRLRVAENLLRKCAIELASATEDGMPLRLDLPTAGGVKHA